jgi:copper chaperone CopZ
MKKIFLLLFAVIAAISASAQFTKASVQANGLTCALCTKAINKSLEKLPFVESVKADIKTSSFLIEFRDQSDVDIDALRKSVEDAGFTVAKLKLTGNFKQLSVKNDVHYNINGKVYHFLGVSSQLLNGEKDLTIVDKNFLPEKQFKKYSAETQMNCVQNGKAGECCKKDGIGSETRIYHVTI